MRNALVISIFLLTACREDLLRRGDTWLVVTPTSLDFGRVTVGDSRARNFTLEGNARDLPLELAAPFSLVAGTVSAPSDVAVTFTPSAPGEFSAQLQVGESLVELHGEGVAREPCVTSEACSDARWDSDEARCVLSQRAEGAGCSTPCVTAGHCEAGACLGGAQTTCDDSDACTVDACDSARGCVHLARACESDNPCRAQRCDAQLGCVATDVEDGIACGARDCSTAHICLSGACVERPVPNGSTCGVASTCQAAGTCVDGACQQPAARQLQLSWSRRLTSGMVDFPGLADSAGNLFWFECTSARPKCDLVSFTSSGVPRYSVPTSFERLANRYRAPTKAILAGELILFGADGVVEAHRHSDGALMWSATLPVRTTGNVSDTRSVSSLAARVPEALYVAGAFFPGWMGQQYQPALARLNLQTGQLDWDRWVTATALGTAVIAAPSVVVDSNGEPVFGGDYHQGVGLTSGYSEQGQVRWSTNAGPVAVTSVIGARVFHSNQGWFDLQGGMHWAPRFQNSMFPNTLETSRGVVMIGVNAPRIVLSSEATGWSKVDLLDFGTWPPGTSPPRLNANGDISFAHHSRTGPMLYDFAPDGAPLAACPFTLTPGEGVDSASPVVELPGLIVMTDNGRQMIWAYAR